MIRKCGRERENVDACMRMRVTTFYFSLTHSLVTKSLFHALTRDAHKR